MSRSDKEYEKASSANSYCPDSTPQLKPYVIESQKDKFPIKAEAYGHHEPLPQYRVVAARRRSESEVRQAEDWAYQPGPQIKGPVHAARARTTNGCCSSLMEE